ncbi:MAG: pyruvate formate-lyase-activating protein [Alphaproteobacteria bacterium]|nr:pyruvate formate-lyase-activating protein [Alphaproteobacteria bacterium]
MQNAIEGYIHSVETAGTVDGPGMRFVVFVTGCPLRCLYCHNPDTRNLTDGKKTTAAELVDEIAQYRDFLSRTGGGVTISGGEPLFQQDFVTAVLQGCKKLGLHTALDTSGYLGNKVKDELLAATDLVLLDIKSFDPFAYRKITGSRLQLTLDFARRLSSFRKPTWIRFVLVPGLTDDLEAIAKMADFIKGLGCVERVEVLPFHKMGEAKWESLGLPYTLKDTEPPATELVKRVQGIFRSHGLVVA